MDITYALDRRPDAAVIAELYRRSPLNRAVDDVARIARMYAGSNLVLTAWEGDKLVGILRAWADGAFDGYICDLAVDPALQSAGIGRELLERCLATNREVQFVLRASKIAERYYHHLGWQKIDNGWFWPRTPWQGLF